MQNINRQNSRVVSRDEKVFVAEVVIENIGRVQARVHSIANIYERALQFYKYKEKSNS